MCAREYQDGAWARTMVWLAAAVGLLASAGCLESVTRKPTPVEKINDVQQVVQVPGMLDIRAWGDEFSESFQADMVESMRQQWAANRERGPANPGDYHVLAISGGGANGAFGAGFLCGWTKAGTRPEFKLVTGVSTGALIAPAAFLGPDYDERIRQIYTETTTKDIVTFRSVFSWLWGDSLADTKPLQNLIEANLDEEVFAAIAAEHRRGRRLYIGTTNLDAGRFVIWNMGAIADSGRPGALGLFRHVMLASASIPVAFPPVYFEVQTGGKVYDEMHVDGGTVAQVFFYEYTLDPSDIMRRAGVAPQNQPPINLHLLYNGKLGPTPVQMRRQIPKIVARSLETLMRARAVGDLHRIYLETKKSGAHFRYIDIPAGYTPQGDEVFDPKEMKRLFQVGYDMAMGTPPWRTLPPGFTEGPLP